MGKITDELFLQGEDDNRGDHVLHLSQDLWRGFDCGDDRSDSLGSVHSGDLLVLSSIELVRINEIRIRGFPALRSNL